MDHRFLVLPFEVVKIMQISFISKNVEDSDVLWPLCEIASKALVSVWAVDLSVF